MANITKPTHTQVQGSVRKYLLLSPVTMQIFTNKHQQDKDMQDMLIDRPRIEINADSSKVYPY